MKPVISGKLVVALIFLAPLACSASFEKPEVVYKSTEELTFAKPAGKFTLSGELLWWKTKIPHLPFAFTSTTVATSPSATTPTHQTFLDVPFSYDPGLRVGAHYEFAADQWDVEFLLTRFRQSASRAAVATSALNLNSTFEIFLGVAPLTNATATVHEHFQTVDFTLGKRFYWSEPFNLRCYFGLKGAWVTEKLGAMYVGPAFGASTATTSIVNRCQAFGFMNGVSTDWSLGKYFSLYSRGELAVLQSRFLLQQCETVVSLATDTFSGSSTNTASSLSMNLVSEIGLKCHIPLREDRARLTLYAAYEFNYWPNQFMITQFLKASISGDASQPILIQPQSDIGFQGFNFGASLEF